MFIYLFYINLNNEWFNLKCNFLFKNNFIDSYESCLSLSLIDISSSLFTSNGFQWKSTSSRGGGLVLYGPLLSNIFNLYSIGIRVKYDFIGPGYKKIIDFQDRNSDTGLYFHGNQIYLFPYFKSNMNFSLKDNTFYDILFSYNSISQIANIFVMEKNLLIINISGICPISTCVPISSSSRPKFNFFIDDNPTSSEATSGGEVQFIKLWNKFFNYSDLSSINLNSGNSFHSNYIFKLFFLKFLF